jgi:tetratricopeptide (TPR) repeat protein
MPLFNTISTRFAAAALQETGARQKSSGMPAMEKSRLEILREMLAADPANTFARYGLAMELASSDPEEAWRSFEHLLEHQPEYVPTYYQAAKVLLSLGRTQQAREVLARGIEAASHQGNEHARSELAALLGEIEGGA